MSNPINLARAVAHPGSMGAFLRLCGLLISLIVSGCASLSGGTPEEVVERRAMERVAFLMEGDFDSAYQYTTPGYRSTVPVREYSGRWVGATMWQDVKVANIKCQEEPAPRCQLALAVTFDSLQTGLVTTHLQETWVKSDRRWYLYQNIGR